MISSLRLTFAGSTRHSNDHQPPEHVQQKTPPPELDLFQHSNELMLNSNDAAQSMGTSILQVYLQAFLKNKQPYLSKGQQAQSIPLPRTLAQHHEQMVHLLHRVAHIGIPGKLDNGKMTLQEAFRGNHPFLVHGVLKRLRGEEGASELNRKDYLGATAIHTAILTRHFPEVEMMLKKGANPFMPDSAGKSLLQRLADMGEIQRLDQLIKPTQPCLIDDQSQVVQGLQRQAKESEQAIADYAAHFSSLSPRQRQLKLVNLGSEKAAPETEKQRLHQVLSLMRLGANIKTFDQFGYSALHWAAQNGHDGLVFAFLQRGADVNAKDDKGNTPLLNAVCSCSSKVMNMLLQAGANASLANGQGNTPLIIGAFRGTGDMVQALIDAGGNVNAANVYRETPLHLAAHSEPGFSSVVEALLKHGADPKAVDSNGTTPLDRAIAKDHENLVKILKPLQ